MVGVPLMVGERARRSPARVAEPARPIWPAALAFFSFFTLCGSVVALGYRHPVRAMLFGLLANLLGLAVNLALSRLLDWRRERAARDSWAWAAALAVVAALASEPAHWAIARLPFLSLHAHSRLIDLESFFEAFLVYLLWIMVHLFVRSGERALVQERRIAAVREAMLRDENEALLFTLNPAFLLDALGRIGASVRHGAHASAGTTVIALAEHMRAALSDRTPEDDVDPADDPELEARRRELASYDETRTRRGFLLWTLIGWACLLGVVLIQAADMKAERMAFLIRVTPQPVLGALWCLTMDRMLSRRRSRALKALYVEAEVLCGAGLLLTSAALFVGAVAVGVSTGRYLSIIPGLEFYYMVPPFLAWTAAWFVLDARRREADRLRSTAEIREAALKAHNAMLRQQVNPHFLFNALNALYALILDCEQERAMAVIGAVRRFVERAGDPAHGDFVALAGELATQDAYLDIERVRFGDRLQVERRVSAELEGARVPHLILQPLVENAIKYGVSRTDQPVRVEITAARAGDELVLQVRDSGAPGAATRPPGLGVGLKNVEGRLRSLYGEAGRLVCAPLSPSGYLAEVRLPLVL